MAQLGDSGSGSDCCLGLWSTERARGSCVCLSSFPMGHFICCLNVLLTRQLASPTASEERKRDTKMEATVFHSLLLDVANHHFHHNLLATQTGTVWASATQQSKHQETEVPGAILEAGYHVPPDPHVCFQVTPNYLQNSAKHSLERKALAPLEIRPKDGEAHRAGRPEVQMRMSPTQCPAQGKSLPLPGLSGPIWIVGGEPEDAEICEMLWSQASELWDGAS